MNSRFAKLIDLFADSPAIALLRSPHGPYIAHFLDEQFKRSSQIVVGHADLVAALIDFQDDLQERGETVFQGKPETYLSEWCSGEKRWLRRVLEAKSREAAYQLTPHSEQVLAFLDRAIDEDLAFVGTESKLRLVIDTLDELVRNASDDPERQLEHLRKQRGLIDEEMQRIERDGAAPRYHAARLRDRFATAVSLLKQLQGDFRAVEEKFREITVQVQQRQNVGKDTRGGILEFALDAEDVLKQEDQGVSFYAFADFILSPAQQEKLREIIDELTSIEDLSQQTDGLNLVQKMVPVLLAEAQKVMRTNQRLSATLRRLLDVRAQHERRRVSEMLREIRSLTTRVSNDSQRRQIGIEMDDRVVLMSPFTRTFWSEPPKLLAVDLSEHAVDTIRRIEAFQQLARLQRLDWSRMNKRINDALARHGAISLASLLAEHPPTAGVVEVMGYVQLAREGGHVIDPGTSEEIVIPADERRLHSIVVTAPLVRFVAKGKVLHG
jgi:hypothetical protein